MSESKAERKKKSDIASVVNYFEESDLTEEELINLSKDMNRIANEYAESQLKELREGLAHTRAGNYRLEQLLKTLGDSFSDEIVDKENGNYFKIKVDDMPEGMIEYID